MPVVKLCKRAKINILNLKFNKAIKFFKKRRRKERRYDKRHMAFLWLNGWFAIAWFIAAFYNYGKTEEWRRRSKTLTKLNRKWDGLIAQKRLGEIDAKNRKKREKCLTELSMLITKAKAAQSESKGEKGLAEAIKKAQKFIDSLK